MKTIYATRFAVQRADMRSGPTRFRFGWNAPAWLKWTTWTQSPLATPKSGTLQFNWDLTNDAGERVPDGTYRYFVEGTIRWKNHVLYTGEITLNGEEVSSQATAEYAYVASDDSPALTDDSAEHGMITNVNAVFTPPTELP